MKNLTSSAQHSSGCFRSVSAQLSKIFHRSSSARLNENFSNLQLWLGHAGKIIFIERDTPAVVISAFYFFQKVAFIQPYLKKHEINDDLQKFARFMMEGKLFYGTPDEYNHKWKNFAKEHPELQIECQYYSLTQNK